MLVSLLLGGGRCAEGQQRLISAQASPPAACRAGIDSLNAGSKNAVAWSHLGHCGAPGISALANRISGFGSETDTLFLDEFMATVAAIRDSAMFRTSRILTADPGATVAARMTGLNILMSQYRAGFDFVRPMGWAVATATPRGSACGAGGGVFEYAHETPLQSDYLQQLAATLDTVSLLRASEAPVMRDAAKCARLYLRSEAPLTVPVSALSLTYVCGTTYRVSNASARTGILQFRLAGTADPRTISVPPGGSRNFFTLKAGTVELLQEGEVIMTEKNGGKGCP